jgi:hypothetical protein
MTADEVMGEIRYGLSELEETSLNVIGEAVTQDRYPVVILENERRYNPNTREYEGGGEYFTVVVLPYDVREGSNGHTND